jgi:ABC-type dipeptide/oligopeptide/nickel transport system ATPase component
VSIRQLTLEATTARGTAHILRGIDLDIGKSRILGVVGESGSGKSSLAACLVRLLPANLSRVSGKIVFDGVDLLALDERAMNAYRGTRIAMIFQDPMTALNPLFTVGTCPTCCANVIPEYGDAAERRDHDALERRHRRCGAADRLSAPAFGRHAPAVIIAMALLVEPDLLLADSPRRPMRQSSADRVIAGGPAPGLRGLDRLHSTISASS